MAVHMSEDEFLALGIEVQREGFTALNQELDTSTAHVEKLDAAVQAVGEISTEPLQKLSSGFAQTNKQIQETNDSLDKLRAGLGDMPDFGDGEGGRSGNLGGVSGLRRTGSALTQLGLPEIGRPVSIAGDIQQVVKEVDQVGDVFKGLPSILGEAATEGGVLAGSMGSVAAVAGPLALAVGAIAVGFKVFITDTLEPANKALADATASVDAYYAAIEKGTTESLKKQIADLEEQKRINDEKISTLAKGLGSGLESAVQNFGPTGAVLYDAAGKAGLLGSELKGTNKDLADAQALSAKYQNDLDGLNRALGSSAVAANDAAKAEKALQDARDKTADKNIQIATQTAQLEATGTSKGIENRIKEIDAEKQAIVDELGAQQVSLDKRIELGKRLGELSAEEGRLTDTILPAVQAREAEEKATKDTEKAINDITKAHESYDKALQSAKDSLNNQIQTAQAREALAEKENRQGSLQDTEQREKIRADEGRKETQLAQESADRIVDIRAKEGQAEQQVQIDLQRQFADDTIKFQEQQQSDALNHEQRIAQIKRDAQDAELDDIANRDFAKLAQDQRGAQKQESQENEKYTQQEQQLAVHLQAEQKQQQVAAERRREDLRNNEAIQIQEQQVADQRKLDALRQSEQYQLDDLTTAEGYKIQILQVGLRDEIALYQQASMQRVQILQNELQAAQAQASQQIYKANAGGTGAFGFANSMNDAIGAIGEALFG